MKLFKKKLSLGLLLFCTFSTGAASLLAYNYLTQKGQSSTQSSDPGCNYNINRLSGYQYIQPLISAEADCQSQKLNDVQLRISDLIEREKAAGTVVSASVYLEDLTDDSWTAINGEEAYHPASLIKVVTLISYLKMAEADPQLLDREMVCDKSKMMIPSQSYITKSIESGKRYKVRELLEYMMAYSDNYATSLLNQGLNLDIFSKVFTDFGLPRPDVRDRGFEISNIAYSKFMKALFNGSYLTIAASDYATSLLCKCDFNKGIVSGIPASTRVAHKFGESKFGGYREMHESAIVYLNNKQYLLTVMTRGNETDRLCGVIGQVSKLAFERMSGERSPI